MAEQDQRTGATLAKDERTEDELYQDVLKAGWGIEFKARLYAGVAVTFRYNHMPDAPGMVPREVTREVSGTDRADAMRKFLAQLQVEKASELVAASGG